MSNTNSNCGPCGPLPENTAEAELLPSQIENFTKQFFGEVTKTLVNGEVSWVLPCDLDIGLANNPRDEGEGLACYFLRLFEQGIIGLTGPQGDAGAVGASGANAFTVTLASFTQPTLDAPTVQVKTAYNPAILAGLNTFIESSGWYNVDQTDTSGYLYLTLTKAVVGAAATISAGKLVVPAGYPGASITGPTGPQGTQGPQGDPGVTYTEDNGMYSASVGTDYALQVVPTAITFVNSDPEILLPKAGTYLITAVVALEGQAGIATVDVASFYLYNSNIASILDGSDQQVNFLQDTQKAQLTINVIASAGAAGQTVKLYGSCSSANVCSVIALRTTLTYVRLDA